MTSKAARAAVSALSASSLLVLALALALALAASEGLPVGDHSGLVWGIRVNVFDILTGGNLGLTSGDDGPGEGGEGNVGGLAGHAG